MNAMWTISKLTFREASRRKILLAACIIGLAFLGIFATGYYFMRNDFISSGRLENRMLMQTMQNLMFTSGMYVVNFLTVAMSALLAADSLSGEINTGTIQTLISKPVRRFEIVIGKWLGFAGLIALYVGAMAGGVILSVYLISGYMAHGLARGVGLLLLNGFVVLSVTLFFSSITSTLATGGAVFGLYGLAFIGGWVERIGSMVQNQLAVNLGVVSSLLFPTEAVWSRAAYEMESVLLSAVGYSPFTSNSIPSPLMIGFSAIYAALFLGLTLYQFRRRDL